MGDIFDGYTPASGPSPTAYDEVVGTSGTLRPQYEEVASALSAMSAVNISTRADRLARAFRHQGVTFDLDGEERPFPVNVVPRVFTTAEWDVVEAGVRQRVRALEAFLADIYGPTRILEEGVMPRELITSSPHFLRPAHGVNPINGVRVNVAGIDIGPRRERSLPGPRGQHPLSLGGELRAGEPAGDGAGPAGDLHRTAHPRRGGLPLRAW